MALLSPSVLGCDFLTLTPVIAALEEAGADMLHMDVMDGVFVPNISFGLPVIRSIHRHTRLPLDVHMMVNNPLPFIEAYAPFAARLGIHYEAAAPLAETLSHIRACGCAPTLTIKPQTDPSVVFPYLDLVDMVLVMSVEPGFGGQAFLESALEKLQVLRAEIDRRGLSVLLEVDGGINDKTGARCVAAGADVLVAGQYLLTAGDIAHTAGLLKSL